MFPHFEIFGAQISLYKTMYVLGVLSMALACLLTGKNYKIGKIRSGIYTLVTFAFGVTGAKLMAQIYTFSMKTVSGGEYIPDSSVCIFGALMFSPILMVVLAIISGESYRKLMDYMTPGIFLILAFAKTGCLLEGCCHGVACENGVYNQYLDYKVFPVQLYEAVCTFFVAACLLIIMKKRGSVRYGALYPAGTLMYCFFRLIWENFRYYEFDCEKNFLLSLTYWQVCGIIACIMSVVWLIVLYKADKFSECDLARHTVAEHAESFAAKKRREKMLRERKEKRERKNRKK